MTIFIAAVLSGIVSGMGIGGGAILIPVLTLALGIPQRQAQLINLIYFIPTAVTALIDHIKNKRIEKAFLPYLTAFGLLGCTVGSFAALALHDGILKKLFGGFLIFMGIRELRTKKGPKP